MDYHGLKLLWTWMYDIDGVNKSIEQIQCKIKIIDVLSTMSIKNRTVLEECKLLDMVRRWANLEDLNSQDLNLEPQVFIKEIVTETLNDILKSSSDEELAVNDQELIDTLINKSKELHETWSNLKVNFKIPKKQRIEERKEHERELNQEELKPSLNSSYQNSGLPISNYESKFNSDRSNRDNLLKVPSNRSRTNYNFSSYERPYNKR